MNPYPKDFVVYQGQEPVAVLRRHSDTSATFLDGSELVYELLRAGVPISHERTVELLGCAGYSIKEGSLPWAKEPVTGYGRRLVPKFWGPPSPNDD